MSWQDRAVWNSIVQQRPQSPVRKGRNKEEGEKNTAGCNWWIDPFLEILKLHWNLWQKNNWTEFRALQIQFMKSFLSFLVKWKGRRFCPTRGHQQRRPQWPPALRLRARRLWKQSVQSSRAASILKTQLFHNFFNNTAFQFHLLINWADENSCT